MIFIEISNYLFHQRFIKFCNDIRFRCLFRPTVYRYAKMAKSKSLRLTVKLGLRFFNIM